MLERLAETNRCCGLSFAKWCWCDGSNYDVLCLRALLQFIDCIKTDLCQALAVRFKQVLADPHLGSNVFQWQWLTRARNFEI